MFHIKCIALLVFFLCACEPVCAASSVTYRLARVAHLKAHVVWIDLNDPDVRVTTAIARGGRGSSESFGSMLHRTSPTAAITGGFFDPRTLTNVGDLILASQCLQKGLIGSRLSISSKNVASFHSRRLSPEIECETGLGLGPSLVRNSRRSVYPRAEGFRDPALFRPNPRTAIGITRANKLALVAVNRKIYLRDMAAIMKGLGCQFAASLDGGTSTALYYRGGVYARPGRKLTNWLLVYSSERDLLKHQVQLAPTWANRTGFGFSKRSG